MSECTDRKCARERELLYAQKNELEEACTRIQEEKETLEYKLNDAEETLETVEARSASRELELAKKIVELRDALAVSAENLEFSHDRNRELLEIEDRLTIKNIELEATNRQLAKYFWYLTIAYLIIWILVRGRQ